MLLKVQYRPLLGLARQSCFPLSRTKRLTIHKNFGTITFSPASEKYITNENSERDPKDFDIHEIEEPKGITAISQLYEEWFANDIRTNSQLEKFSELYKKSPQDIRIGLLYDNETVLLNSKIVESLLADPLSSQNKEWFDLIAMRSKNVNNTFKSSAPDSDPILASAKTKSDVYEIPSPLLSSKTHLLYKQAAIENIELSDFHVFNNIKLIEITNRFKITNISTYCHYFIYITNDISKKTEKYPKDLRDQILFTVIDNQEFTPTSNESTPLNYDELINHHVIKINSRKSFEGIVDFLENDTKAATRYIEGLSNSNIFELCKFIYLYLNSGILSDKIRKAIIEELSIKTPRKLDDGLYQTLKTKDLQDFSNKMHEELQNSFIPKTTNYFKSLRWWKLYLKNDNIEYDLKDYFNEHFMNESIENYNYFRGQISSQLQQQKFGNYKIDSRINNPLLKLKNKLLIEKIENEIQPVVYTSLVQAFTFYQLPISILSFFSYQYFGFGLEGACALALLGWVLGFNHVSKKWEVFTRQWLKNLFEDVRIKLGRDCIDNGLLKELNLKYNEEVNLINVKKQVVKGLQKL